jgi:hypothetical protein
MPCRQLRPFRFGATGIEPTLLGGDGIAGLASVSFFVRGIFVRTKRSAGGGKLLRIRRKSERGSRASMLRSSVK